LGILRGGVLMIFGCFLFLLGPRLYAGGQLVSLIRECLPLKAGKRGKSRMDSAPLRLRGKAG
jgi:hypothetical protein